MDARQHTYRSRTHRFEIGEKTVFKVTVLPFTADAFIQIMAFLETENAEKAIPGIVALILGQSEASERIAESLIILLQKVFPRLGNLALDVIAATIEVLRIGQEENQELGYDDVIAFLKKLCLDDLLELFTDAIELMSVDRLKAVFTRLGACFKSAKIRENQKPAPSAEHPALKR